MNRRRFVFGSLASAALFAPLLKGRRAAAAGEPPRRLFVWVCSGGYPYAEDFFPESGDAFTTPILRALEPVREQALVVDGVDIRPTGPRPRGNDHIRSIGKVITARDVFDIGGDEGEPGGPSIDHVVAEHLGLRKTLVLVEQRQPRSMRERPFATGARRFATPVQSPAQVWENLFRDLAAGAADEQAAREATRARLRARQSILDDLGGELRRLRAELVGVEHEKLDVLEDSLRRAESSAAEDLALAEAAPVCTIPDAPGDARNIPQLSRAHFDVLHAAFLCDRTQVGGMMFGRSGYRWDYQNWIDVRFPGNAHDDVHHQAGSRRETYQGMVHWDWGELGGFIQRLRDTPDGSGSLLDSTLVLGISHFGRHHHLERIPVVLAGGPVRGGRVIRPGRTVYNDQVLTSVAHMMGVPIEGIGDDPACGRLEELHG